MTSVEIAGLVPPSFPGTRPAPCRMPQTHTWSGDFRDANLAADTHVTAKAQGLTTCGAGERGRPCDSDTAPTHTRCVRRVIRPAAGARRKRSDTARGDIGSLGNTRRGASGWTRPF